MNIWFNNFAFSWISFEPASAYYTNFSNQRLLALRPMIGIGLVGFQIVYEYGVMLVKPNFDFGGNSRVGVRINLGMLELNS